MSITQTPPAGSKPKLSAPPKPGVKPPTGVAAATSTALATKPAPAQVVKPPAAPAAAALMKSTYQAPDLDLMRKKLKKAKDDRASARSRQDRLKLAEGKNNIRILPGDTPDPFYVTYVHYIRNPAKPGVGGRPVVCPMKTRNAPCIVCKKVAMLNRSGTKTDKDVAADIRAQKQVLVNAIDVTAPDKGVRVLTLPGGVYEDLLGLLLGDETNPEEFPAVDFTHPEQGFNIQIEKEVGDKTNLKETTKYGKPKLSVKASAVPYKDWLTKRYDLSKSFETLDEERTQAIMEGTEPSEEEEVPSAGTVEDDMA